MEKNKKGTLIGKVAQKLKANKRMELVVYGGLVALILALYLSTLFPTDESTPQSNATQTDTETATAEQDVEEKLSEVLSSIKGAGKVVVMITFETGPELVTAMTTDTNTNRSATVDDGKQSNTEQQTQSQQPATISGNEGTSPIILTEKQPAVRGVIVIAEGAGNIAVRMNLQRAVQTVLAVSVDCIEVFEHEAQTSGA